MSALESQYSTPVLATATDALAPAKVLNVLFSVVQGQVILNWDAVTANADDSAITDLAGYRIYRKDDAGSSFALVGSVTAAVDAQVTTYTDSSAQDGASYVYAVAAVDNEATPNEGAYSDDLAVKTIPSVPANVHVVAGDALIRVIWDSVQDVGTPKKNENLAGYKVYRKLSADAGAHVFLTQVANNVVMYEDTTVVNGTEYSYVVTSIDNSL
jgi:fibronectin type 3 domain-containing protein